MKTLTMAHGMLFGALAVLAGCGDDGAAADDGGGGP